MNGTERWTGLDDWAVVCQFLPENWEAAARQTGALRRARGIRDAPTLLRTLLVHLADGCSLAETAVWVRAAGWCAVSAVALLKRLRAAEEWLRWAQRQLRRKARRKQVTLSAAALRAAGYVFVWTSVPAEVLTAAEVMELYRLRWQIELAFKRLKSLMGLGHLPKWSDASCRAWIHGKLFIALLIERLLEAAEAVSPWGYHLVAAPQPLA